MNTVTRQLLVSILLCFHVLCPGQDAGQFYFLDSTTFKATLFPFGTYFIDSTGKLDQAKITSKFANGEGKPLTDKLLVDFPTKVWAQLQLVSARDLVGWELFFKQPEARGAVNKLPYHAENGRIKAYFSNKGVTKEFISGVLVPASKKWTPDYHYFERFPINIAAGDTLDMLFAIESMTKQKIFSLQMELRHPDLGLPFEKSEFGRLLFPTFTVIFFFGIFNLIFFWVVRQRSYLYFGLFCMLYSVHGPILEPYQLYINYFPERPYLIFLFFFLSTTVSIYLFLLFISEFAGLKQKLPTWDRVLKIFLGLMFTVAFVRIFLFFRPPYGLTINEVGDLIFSLFYWALLSVLLVYLIRISVLKQAESRIIAIGGIWMFLFIVMGQLWNAGIIDLPFNPWPFAPIGMILIYSVGMAWKLRRDALRSAELSKVQELDAIKTRFFANVSHEFRTPLSLILGPVRQAREQIPASDAQAPDAVVEVPARHLNVIERNAQRLLQLINQLLDLSKLDSGELKLRVEQFDLLGFCRALVFSFESLADRKQIHYQTSFPSEQVLGWADRDKFEKILVNLLSNAFKYTPERGTIFVRFQIDADRLVLHVKDSGPGIAPEDVDKVFDRFYQVEGSESKGSGIGLALVRELVEVHKGTISLESNPGQGTTFRVSFPIRENAYSQSEKVIGKEQQHHINPVFAGNGHLDESVLPVEEDDPEEDYNNEKPLILVVEDHPDLRQFISEILKPQYRILLAKDGKTGLQTALKELPDLIVSDVMMPKMSGFELCEAIKKDAHTCHIPLILLTAKAGQSNKLEGLEIGADDYLTKPFDSKELLVRVDNLISQRRQLQEKYSNHPSILKVKKKLVSMDEKFLRQVMEVIEKNIQNEFFSVEELAESVAFSRSQLHRKLKAISDTSPNELIRKVRLQRAKELLEQKTANVSEVASMVGYGSLSYFTRSFKKTFGKLPSDI